MKLIKNLSITLVLLLALMISCAKEQLNEPIQSSKMSSDASVLKSTKTKAGSGTLAMIKNANQ